MAGRRFSQAISEGDGISLLARVEDADSAREAAAQGAEAVVAYGAMQGIRDATDLPILWSGAISEALNAGADACVVVLEDHVDEDGRLEALHTEATELGLDVVVEVRNEEELALALELLDPEIFLLSGPGNEDDGPLGPALELLPDVPAGKLAVADVPVAAREQVDELERAGVDAVIVAAGHVADLVGDTPPPV
ncbi:MAG TPA: hypothetical protein VEH52_04425 [Gaiellaceae bacterium]|jgi:indole-3-glycerol phosphate synthase|nr:hypothetical protein [Gaiellaceae bacterium]